jgi:hypothetical protein
MEILIIRRISVSIRRTVINYNSAAKEINRHFGNIVKKIGNSNNTDSHY